MVIVAKIYITDYIFQKTMKQVSDFIMTKYLRYLLYKMKCHESAANINYNRIAAATYITQNFRINPILI
jgi:F0F1-type ATP synthase gamma subunit